MAPGVLNHVAELPEEPTADTRQPASKIQSGSITTTVPFLNGNHNQEHISKTHYLQLPNPSSGRHSADNESTASDALLFRLSQTYANPSLHVTPAQTIELRPTPLPRPSHTQVLLHIRATGICGSDMHLWRHGAIGPLVVDRPCILGHEAAGVVLAAGSAVTNLAPGDRVAIEPGVPCGSCWLCASGRYNLCEGVAFTGVCPFPGTIRRFAVHEARFCHRLPSSISFAQGALLEPLSVVLHALGRCRAVGIGRPLLVCGAGPIGLIALKAARASGAWPLVITDVDEKRLEFAKRFVPGASTYQVRAGCSVERTADEIRALFGVSSRDRDSSLTDAAAENGSEYKAPATVLECTGVESSVATAAYCARRGGEVIVVGVGKSVMNNLPFMHLSLAEVSPLPFPSFHHHPVSFIPAHAPLPESRR